MALGDVIPPPEEDPSRCRLLGPTALVVQGLMGVFVLLSLVAKRQLEKRKRPWRIWIWDVGKQLVGQAVIHGLNLLISDLVAHAADNNPCSLYFLNVLIDTTFGVAIFYFALKGFTWYFAVYRGLEGFVSGQYGFPPQARFWWCQLAPYLLSIISMKTLVLLPLTLPGISTALLGLGHALLDYLSPKAQVIFVMALFPLVMNIIQFCLVDQFIKASAGVLGVEGKHEDGDGIHGDDGDEGEELDEDEEGGYKRLPTGELDVESGRSGFMAAASGSGTRSSFGVGRQARRRSSTKDVANFASPALPNSPLLLPIAGSLTVDSRPPPTSLLPDYGSTSPRRSISDLTKSPLGEAKNNLDVPPVHANSVADPESKGKSKASETFWSKIMGSESIKVEDEEQGMLDTAMSLSTGVSPRDIHRSGAPSPDSSRAPLGQSPFTLATDDVSDDDDIDDIPRLDLTSSTPLPPSTTFSTISTFSHGSGGLTDGIRKQASRDLSPSSEYVPHFGDSGDREGTSKSRKGKVKGVELGLKDLP